MGLGMMEPGAAAAAYSRSLALLRAGRFSDAWPLFEARRSIPHFDAKPPVADYPEWQGQDLVGKRIMVVAEQGWGDQMMFGRYLAPLARLGCTIEILCHPTVWPVFGMAGYSGHPHFVDRAAPPADYWVLMGSLPLRLGLHEPPPPVYLPISSGSTGVGVKTFGNPKHTNDRNRSLPPPEASALRGLGIDLDPKVSGANSFLETAVAVAGLKLVVSVDTAVAHLAGIMGKPLWVLLPYEGLDWRWGDGIQSRWYPNATLFRQEAPGDWISVLERVKTALQRQGAMAT